MDGKKCEYEGCENLVALPLKGKYCLFHAPIDEKGISVEEFNKRIFGKIAKKDYNFNGYVFPSGIIFKKDGKLDGKPILFEDNVNFSQAKFKGYIDFSKVTFYKDADFSNAHFSDGDVDFSNVKFSGSALFNFTKFKNDANFRWCNFLGLTYFSHANFSRNTTFEHSYFSELVIFSNVHFSGIVDFNGAKFNSDIDFLYTKFLGYAEYLGTQFLGYTNFYESKFDGQINFLRTHFDERANFMGVQISGNIYFTDNVIINDMDFSNILLGDKSVFYFIKPKFINEDNEKNKNKKIRIVFDRVRFNPFATHFENISLSPDKKEKTPNVTLIYRYCQLKDVYFTNNDMSLFSFYTSSFDEARFISSDWGFNKEKIIKFIPFDRKNIISEEYFLNEIKKFKGKQNKIDQINNDYDIKDLKGYEDIASLYRRMKTALDHTKDYQQASWFYFNEFEMKRLALKENIENSKPKWKIFKREPLTFIYQFFKKIFSKNIIYIFYKTFAGYGEKPLWSFLWFLIFVLLFSILNLFIGIQIEENNNLKNINFGDSLLFTLYRIIPVNYLPFQYNFIVPHNFWSLLVPFLNTVVLIIMFAFILIGLKRHFRRF